MSAFRKAPVLLACLALPTALLADDSLCIVTPEMEGANFALAEADVSKQPGGTNVSCRYDTETAGNFTGGLTFGAACPAGTSVVAPGYLLPVDPDVRVRALRARHTSDGTSEAVVALAHTQVLGQVEVTVYALCN
jgi:hypothetical protein